MIPLGVAPMVAAATAPDQCTQGSICEQESLRKDHEVSNLGIGTAKQLKAELRPVKDISLLMQFPSVRRHLKVHATRLGRITEPIECTPRNMSLRTFLLCSVRSVLNPRR